MKISLLITLIFFSFVSCVPKTDKSLNEKNKNDIVLNLKQKKDKAIKDSILQIEQSKVLGGIEFGMSKKEFDLAFKKFLYEQRQPDKVLGKDFYEYYIGNYEFNGISFVDLYFEEKLYFLKLYGEYIDWKDYDSKVPKEIKYITDVIKLKYKEPNITNDIPEPYNMNEDYIYVVNSWDVGSKKIEVLVNDQGTWYTVDLRIYQPSIMEKIKKEKEKLEQQNTKENKDVF